MVAVICKRCWKKIKEINIKEWGYELVLCSYCESVTRLLGQLYK